MPREMQVRVSVPTGVAQQICKRAQLEFGHDTVTEIGGHTTQVSVWLGGRRHIHSGSDRAVAAFWLRWEYPSRGQATIDRLGWDPLHGGSLDEVVEVIEVLAGWPIWSGRNPLDGAPAGGHRS
jgi:hypothetical protein